MEIEPPARERSVLPRCRCVVVLIATGDRDECPDFTPDPDSPFCDNCASMHQGRDLGSSVTAKVRGVE